MNTLTVTFHKQRLVTSMFLILNDFTTKVHLIRMRQVYCGFTRPTHTNWSLPTEYCIHDPPAADGLSRLNQLRVQEEPTLSSHLCYVLCYECVCVCLCTAIVNIVILGAAPPVSVCGWVSVMRSSDILKRP